MIVPFLTSITCLKEKRCGCFHGILVEDNERYEVTDESQHTDQPVDTVNHELVQQTAGRHLVVSGGQSTGHSVADVIADVTV